MSSIAVMRPGQQEQTLCNYDYDLPLASPLPQHPVPLVLFDIVCERVRTTPRALHMCSTHTCAHNPARTRALGGGGHACTHSPTHTHAHTPDISDMSDMIVIHSLHTVLFFVSLTVC